MKVNVGICWNLVDEAVRDYGDDAAQAPRGEPQRNDAKIG